MKVLQEMNDLDAGHDDFVKSLAPAVNVLKNEAEIATQPILASCK